MYTVREEMVTVLVIRTVTIVVVLVMRIVTYSLEVVVAVATINDLLPFLLTKTLRI